MSFPIDDSTLDAIEHAMGGVLVIDPETGDPVFTGADYSMYDLMDFLSGVSEADWENDVDEYGVETGNRTIRNKTLYCERDLTKALISEVRRLRTLIAEQAPINISA